MTITMWDSTAYPAAPKSRAALASSLAPDLGRQVGADDVQAAQRGVEGVRGAAAGVRVRLGAGQPYGQSGDEVIEVAADGAASRGSVLAMGGTAGVVSRFRHLGK